VSRTTIRKRRSPLPSFNPAHLLGLSYECGSIELGKRADLVALDPDGHVLLTLVAGRIAISN
jgi:N-acetylglucosamine-6-phosphate deacetylase